MDKEMEELQKKIQRIPYIADEQLEWRFAFHPATDVEKKNDHASVRQHCLELAKFINKKVPEGREKSLAITKLEEVMMWANAGIARSSEK